MVQSIFLEILYFCTYKYQQCMYMIAVSIIAAERYLYALKAHMFVL